MAQLKQDEWPKDDEPTTAEQENGEFKREGPHPPPPNRSEAARDSDRIPYRPATASDPDTPDE